MRFLDVEFQGLLLHFRSFNFNERLRRIRLPRCNRIPQRGHVDCFHAHLAEQRGELNFVGLHDEKTSHVFLRSCIAVPFGFKVRASTVHEMRDLIAGQRGQLLCINDA